MTDTCDTCGREYNVVYRVSNNLWAQIAPKPGELGGYPEHQFGGLLCPDCATTAARRLGITLRFDAGENWGGGTPSREAVEALVCRKQSINHDPENGKFGDCYRTCIAMILGRDPQDVPHFCDGYTDGVNGLREWLAPQGLLLWTIVCPPQETLDSILKKTAFMSPGVPMIITGKGTGTVNHCVVALDGKVFCDPRTGKSSPPDDALTGPAEAEDERWWWIEAIVASPALLAQRERDEKVIAAAIKLEGAVDHERSMACQDIGMQLQTIEAVDQALVVFRNALAARDAGEGE